MYNLFGFIVNGSKTECYVHINENPEDMEISISLNEIVIFSRTWN